MLKRTVSSASQVAPVEAVKKVRTIASTMVYMNVVCCVLQLFNNH